MPLSAARWKEVRRANFDKLVAFLSPRFAHFLGDDAEVAAGVLGPELGRVADPVDGLDHLEVDRRDWNPALDRLAAAGHTVCYTEV